MATPAPRWTRLEHDARRTQILSCARALFSERPAASISMTEIASAAGVTRGLLHHYFGSKHELELEVVRAMLYVPDTPVPEDLEGSDLEQILGSYLDRWLTMIERNRETWFATLGSQGLGRDEQLQALLEESRERAAARIVAPVVARDAGADPEALQAIVRGFGAMGEAITAEWLLRGRLTRAEAHTLLLNTLMSLICDVAPTVAAMRVQPQRKST